MKKISLFMLVIAHAAALHAGPKFDSFIKSANTRRKQALATVLFYRERGITNSFQYADKQIADVSEKAGIIGIPEEIELELSSIKSPTDRSKKQVEILEGYYQQILRALPANKRFFYDTTQRKLPETLLPKASIKPLKK